LPVINKKEGGSHGVRTGVLTAGAAIDRVAYGNVLAIEGAHLVD